MKEKDRKGNTSLGCGCFIIILLIVAGVFWWAHNKDAGPSIRPASLSFDSVTNSDDSYDYDVLQVKNYKVNVSSDKATIYHVQTLKLPKTKHFRGTSDKVNGFIRFFIKFNTNDAVEPKFGQAVATLPDDKYQMDIRTAGLVENRSPKTNRKDLVFSNYNNWKDVDLDTTDTKYSIVLPVEHLDKNHRFTYKVQYSINAGKWQTSNFNIKF